MKKKTTAIVLAAGQGKRMKSDVHKQYLLIKDKPVLYYSLKAMEDSFVDDVILVVGSGEQDFCRKEIVEKFEFKKIRAIVEGGKERYHSVYYGLKGITWQCDYVFIHDGARPFIDNELLERTYKSVDECKACVVGMPVKDTVKIADDNGYVESTPTRSKVWQVQTPQAFSYDIIGSAYEKLIIYEEELHGKGIAITDDAMVVEFFEKINVKLVEGSYQNIKITTPEDLKIAAAFLD